MTPTPEQVRAALADHIPDIAVTIEEVEVLRIARFRCWCGATHQHGAGRVTDGPVGEFLGHRAAHCTNKRLYPRGYNLVLADEHHDGHEKRRARATDEEIVE